MTYLQTITSQNKVILLRLALVRGAGFSNHSKQDKTEHLLCKLYANKKALTKIICKGLIILWAQLGTIQRPSDYESDALTS